jgi:hypothetical protein
MIGILRIYSKAFLEKLAIEELSRWPNSFLKVSVDQFS